MSKETEDKDDINFELELGFYPGICVGVRTYPEKNYSQHVLYLPFVELCLTIYNND